MAIRRERQGMCREQAVSGKFPFSGNQAWPSQWISPFTAIPAAAVMLPPRKKPSPPSHSMACTCCGSMISPAKKAGRGSQLGSFHWYIFRAGCLLLSGLTRCQGIQTAGGGCHQLVHRVGQTFPKRLPGTCIRFPASHMTAGILPAKLKSPPPAPLPSGMEPNAVATASKLLNDIRL